MVKKINKFLLFFISLTLFTALPAVFSQERSSIAVIPMKNFSGLPEYTTLCETVTDTVTSVIRFLPAYNLVEATDNPDLLDLDTANLENLKQFSEDFGYDEILFGNLTRNAEDKLLFRLQIYDLTEHDIIVEEEAVAQTLLDVFDTADMMTLALLGQITDVNIGFGTIELIKTGGQGNYEVYLDEKKIRNPQKNFDKVLNGDYLLEIKQERILGETVIFSNRVYVNEFQTTTVRFSIPKATEEELRFILIRNGEMLDTASDPENLDQFLTEIAEFQELTKDIDYDPELVELKDTIIEELGDRAAFLLEETMEKADESYYADDPDFEEANQIYSRITGLVNNNFSYSQADLEGPSNINAESELMYSAAGLIYLLDGDVSKRLSALGPDGTLIAGRELDEWDELPGKLSIAPDSEGNCFIFASGTAEVLRYTSTLEEPTRLTIPDYVPDPDSPLLIAVSAGNAVYLIGNRTSVVFEYILGNTVTVERDSVIEENLRTVLASYPGVPVSNVFFDETNVLYIYLADASAVLQLNSLGELIGSVSFPEMGTVSDIALDGLGYYYFSLPEEHRIVKYSPKGEFISEFGESGDEEGEFDTPEAIAVSSDGTVFVAESGNNRLQVLTLAAPPLLLPAVARYGEQFNRRKETASEAVRKFETVSTESTFFRSTAKYIVPLGIIGASAGLGILDAFLYRNSMNNFSEYQNSTDPEAVLDLKRKAQLNWVFSRVSLYTGYAAMGVGSYWLATSITESIDSRVQRSRTIEYLQSFDMDKDYLVDEDKFRSLQTAHILGITTGIIPPLAGGATALVLSLIPEVNPQIARAVAAGLIAIPPIFSHVYAGQMSWGNFTVGIIADLMALSSFLFSQDVSKSVFFDSIEEPAERGTRYLETAGEWFFTDYFLVGALVFRFVAGLHDLQRGWERANEYNTYEAVIERPEPLSFRASPYFDEKGSPGLAFTLQW